MSTIDEVKQMEARLVEAELGPDPNFFMRVWVKKPSGWQIVVGTSSNS